MGIYHGCSIEGKRVEGKVYRISVDGSPYGYIDRSMNQFTFANGSTQSSCDAVDKMRKLRDFMDIQCPEWLNTYVRINDAPGKYVMHM